MFRLAWKGFLRYRKRRKNLTLVLVTSFSLTLLFVAVFAQLDRNIEHYWSGRLMGGNVIVSSSVEYYDFFAPLSLEKTFEFSQLMDQLPNSGRVFAPRLRVGALLEQTQEEPVLLVGIDPQAERELGNHIVIEEGDWVSSGKNEVVMSAALASTLGAQLGDQLKLTFLGADGYPSYELLTLTGHLSFGNASQIYGDNIAYVPLNTLRELARIGPDHLNEVVTNATAVELNLSAEFRFIPVSGELGLPRLINMALWGLKVLLSLLFGSFLAYTIAHNVALMLEERQREVAVYLTFGAPPSWIRQVMALELFFYASHCFILASVFGSLLMMGFNGLGLYSVNIATEIFMSSEHFVLAFVPQYYVECFTVLLVLITLGAWRILVRSTNRLSVKELG